MSEEAKIKVVLDTRDARRRLKRTRGAVARGGVAPAGVSSGGTITTAAAGGVVGATAIGGFTGVQQAGPSEPSQRTIKAEEFARKKEERLNRLERKRNVKIQKRREKFRTDVARLLEKNSSRTLVTINNRFRTGSDIVGAGLTKAAKIARAGVRAGAFTLKSPLKTVQNVTVAGSVAVGAAAVPAANALIESLGVIKTAGAAAGAVAGVALGFEKLEPFIRRTEPGFFVESTANLGNVIATASGDISAQAKSLFEASRIRGAATLFGGSFPSATTTMIQARLAGVRAKQSIQKSNIRAAIAKQAGPQFIETLFDMAKNDVSH